MSRFALVCVVVTAAIAVVPASMAAGTRSAGSPPVAGAWKLHSANNGAPEVKSGAFTITSHLFVSGFHLTLGPGAETPCGTGSITVKVLGQQQLNRDPSNDLGGPTNEYAVSSPTNVITPVKVQVVVNGKHESGAIEIAFGPGTRGGPHTGGDLYYDDNNCDLSFGATKA
ncbi:MAG TPA: hypothetical protein VH063_17470 [Gaiellaceae bacterium]|jgi:hypothetical protein|nr:hypothetical protein [Gaiellaceae bacterium]